MKEKALEVLRILNENDYDAFIVGGYVRDMLLDRKTSDIDIATSATPKEVLEIFDNVSVDNEKYGSVIVTYKGIKFDVTTFRKEIKYEANRKPIKIKYIKDIKKDLKRRDFTINTLCMNSNGKVIDILDVKSDLDHKILRTVGRPSRRLKEDALRILRCIRFATILDFSIDAKTARYVTKYSYLLKKLSYSRKKEELDKIFSSPNKEKGCKYLIDLNLTNALDINKLGSITLCDDLIGIWTQLEVEDIYPFTKLEKEEMKKLRRLLEYDEIDNYLLYKYGLYLCTVYADIKGISKRKINTMYENLPITSKKDLALNGSEIAKVLSKEEGKYISDITLDIEKNILNGNLNNAYDDIKDYLIKTYLNV